MLLNEAILNGRISPLDTFSSPMPSTSLLFEQIADPVRTGHYL